MSQGRYRAGVIGLGVMGSIADGLGGRHPLWFRPCSHADVYEFHSQTELVAGSTRDPGRQQLFRETHGDKPVYDDFAKMLAVEELDIVSIATPATCHAEIAIAAAEAGVKGIYCEKAMAVSLAECDAMLAACERTGAILAINHQRRWDDRARALKRLLAEGAIGELQSIQISFGGGRLCRGGSHMFDLALMMSDDAVARGCGWLSNPEEFDPGGIGMFETRRGIRITVDGSVGMQHQFQADLVGNDGILRIVDGGFEIELWSRDSESEFGHMARRHLPMNYSVGNPMVNAVDDLVQCMENGTQPLSSGYHGRSAFEMIATIHHSHSHDRAFVDIAMLNREVVIRSN